MCGVRGAVPQQAGSLEGLPGAGVVVGGHARGWSWSLSMQQGRLALRNSSCSPCLQVLLAQPVSLSVSGGVQHTQTQQQPV